MATVSIHMPEQTGLTGQTLYLRKTSDGTLVNTGGDSLTESPASSGRFTATVAESWTETLSATVKNSGGLAVRDGWLHVDETIIVDTNRGDITTELAKVPKSGETRRYTQEAVDLNNRTADVSIGDPL